jgi:hypothetical protein
VIFGFAAYGLSIALMWTWMMGVQRRFLDRVMEPRDPTDSSRFLSYNAAAQRALDTPQDDQTVEALRLAARNAFRLTIIVAFGAFFPALVVAGWFEQIYASADDVTRALIWVASAVLGGVGTVVVYRRLLKV